MKKGTPKNKTIWSVKRLTQRDFLMLSKTKIPSINSEPIEKDIKPDTLGLVQRGLGGWNKRMQLCITREEAVKRSSTDIFGLVRTEKTQHIDIELISEITIIPTMVLL